MAKKNLNTYIDSETQSLNSFEKDTYLQNDEEVNNIKLLNYDDYIIKTGLEIFKYENEFISSTKLVPNNEYRIYGDPDRWKLDCAQQFYNCGIVSALNVNSIGNFIFLTSETERNMTEFALKNHLCTDVTDNNNTIFEESNIIDAADGGTYVDDIRALTTYNGAVSSIKTGYNINSLAEDIKLGKGIIIIINSEDLYKQTLQDNKGNHAVVVTGVVYDTNDVIQGFFICDSNNGIKDNTYKSIYYDKTTLEHAWNYDTQLYRNDSYTFAKKVAIVSNECIKEWSNNIDATGNDSDNIITGNNGDNTLRGLGGNDTLDGGKGADTLIGGTGNDTYVFDDESEFNTDIVIEKENEGDSDTLDFQKVTQDIDIDLTKNNGKVFDEDSDISGIENVYGTSGNDTIKGQNSDNILLGKEGDDTLFGEDGKDILIAGKTKLSIEEIRALNSNSSINTSEFETIEGGENTLDGGADNDILIGDKGNDTLYGGCDNDTVYGGKGNDTIYGDDENNVYEGNDVIYGGEGNDTIYGGKGDDVIVAGSSPITSEAIRSLAEKNSLVANNFMSYEKFENNLYGGEDSDVIIGDSGNDIIHGDGGKDYLYGGDGDDTIYGDDGDDYLNGGEGNDKLYGGKGNDTYSFAENDGKDTIIDSDGQGKILVDDTQLFGSSQDPISDNVWKDNDGNMYFWSGSDETTLLIKTTSNNNITVENFKNGDLGIYLKKPKDKPKKPEGYFDNASKESGIPHDPIIFDLNSDGVIETTDINNGIHFDHENDGFAEVSAWVGENDGILVVDTNSNNKIDNGTELVLHDNLISYDTNNDGIVNENDTDFNNLKILKKDGSLLTLEEAGIASINTNSTSCNFTDDKGNCRFAEGSFTKNDGTTGIYGEYMVKVNTANSKAVNLLDETEATTALPNIAGRGNVYSLHQAMLRDEIGVLNQLVTSFVSETNDNVRKSLAEQILTKWTNTNSVEPNSRGEYVNAQHLVILEKFMGRNYWSTYEEENSEENTNPANPNKEAGAMLETAYELLKVNIYAELMSQTHLKDLMSLITVNYDEDEKVVKYDLNEVTIKLQEAILEDSETGRALAVQFVTTLKGLEMDANSNYFDPLNDNCLYTALTKDDRELKWQFDKIGKITSPFQSSENYEGFNGDLLNIADNYYRAAQNEILYLDALAGNDVIYGGNRNDCVVACSGDDIVDGGDGDDYLGGNGGHDIIWGGNGNDTVDGGEGNDVLYGGNGNDSIIGDYDDERLPWAGNDIIIGGKGNDTIYDPQGNEIYIFNLGDGQDTITDLGGVDYINFGEEISWENLTFTKNGNDMIISINDTTDQITVKNWFDTTNEYSYDHNYKIEQFRFVDGSIHSKNEIEIETTKDTFAFIGTNENDSFTGTFCDDTFEGKGGDNDSFYDDAGGNDTYIYNIGDGYDWIYDKYGYDTIQFGEGITASMLTMNKWNEGQLEITFNGIEGNIVITDYFNDVRNRIEKIVLADGTEITDFTPYFSFLRLLTFNIGDGQQYIDSSNDINAIRFGEGITTENINLLKDVDYNSLHIYFDIENANEDHITVENCFGENTNRIDELIFADGTEITNIEQFIKAYGSESDIILPRNIREAHLWGNDNISAVGNNLDNHINGNAGNNVVTGGRGNDSYWDDQGGNDTYIYNIGDGYDWIYDKYGYDTIQLGEGITASMLTMNKWDAGQLEITFDGIEGNIVIDNYFNDIENRIERIVLADGTEITNFTPYMTYIETDSDFVAFEKSRDIVAIGEGDISLTGNDNENHFTGNSGNNTFVGKGGSDSYWDEAGGNDTYIYNYGDSWDWIHDKYGNDTIQFTEGITTANTQFVKQNNSLEIRILDENGSCIGNTLIDNYFDESNDYKIETVKFADGTIITDFSDKLHGLISETENVVLTGNQIEGGVWGEANLNVTGNNLDNQINGNAGNNVMTGGQGNDAYWDEEGGDDTYVYNIGDGFDWIHDKFGYDTIQLGEGITASMLTMNKWNDGQLEITFDGIEGNIVIDNYFNDADCKIEKIVLSDGTEITDFTPYFTFAETDTNYTAPENSKVQNITATGDGNISLRGNSNNNNICGNSGNNTFEGKGGDDRLVDNQGGNDAYIYNLGDGNDTINDIGGYDTIKFGEGITLENLALMQTSSSLNIWFHDREGGIVIEDYFTNPDNKIEKFELADGTVITDISNYITAIGSEESIVLPDGISQAHLWGEGNTSATGNSLNNWIGGNSGNNTFEGKEGDDFFVDDQGGDDTYIYNLGDGNDFITDIGGNDTIKFGEGITSDNIGIMRDDYDNMHIRFDNGEEIIIESQYNNNDNKIENIQFADGTVISDINSLTNQIGSALGNIVLPDGYKEAHLWEDGNFNITGNNSDNFIRGNAGNNILEGKGGNDYFSDEQGGDDTYIYNLGDGHDNISDLNGNDTIQFGSGISVNDVTFSQSQDGGLSITFANQEGSIYIDNYFNTNEDRKIENFSFADGTTLTDISDRINYYVDEQNTDSVIEPNNDNNTNSSNDFDVNLLIQEINAYGVDNDVVMTNTQNQNDDILLVMGN